MKKLLLFPLLLLLFASAAPPKGSSSAVKAHYQKRAQDLSVPVADRLAAYDTLLSFDRGNTRLLLQKIRLLNHEHDFSTTMPLLDSLWARRDKMSLSLKLNTLDELIIGLSASDDYSSAYFRAYEMLDTKKPDSLRYYDVSALFRLAAVSGRVNDLYQAQKLLNRAIDLAGKVEWPTRQARDEMIGRLYGQQGSFYIDEKKYDEAFTSLEKSLQATDDPVVNALTTANIGMVYFSMGKCDIAKEYLSRVAEMYLPTTKKKLVVFMLGETLRRLGDLENAKAVYDAVDTIDAKTESDRNEKALLVGKALIEGDLGNYKSAFYYMVDAYQMAESIKARQQKVHAVNSKRQIAMLQEAKADGRHKVLFICISGALLLVTAGFGVWIWTLKRGRRKDRAMIDRCGELDRMVELQRRSLENESLKTADISNIYTAIRDAMVEIRDTIDGSLTPAQKIDRIKRIAKGHDVSERLLTADRHVREITDPVLLTTLQRLYPKLTKGELEMCMFIRQGYTSKQIADITCRSRRTIDVIKHNLRRKLDIPPTADISAFLLDLRDK